MSSFLNFQSIERLVSEGYISRKMHPNDDSLAIYNYTAKTQYERNWTPETLQCRGLICRGEDIEARPFPKFFNYEELESPPESHYRVFEKMDGSLGILYWLDGDPWIATRGSFDSDQARWATKYLREHRDLFPFIESPEPVTYLFEIIYPENRIVVDYKGHRGLTLLGVICNQTGDEFELPDSDFAVKEYEPAAIDRLMKEQRPDAEGYVLRYECGTRVKIKFEEYKRLHRLLTGISNRSIWELLRSGQDSSAIIDNVPDEFYQWVKNTESDLLRKFGDIEARAKSEFSKRPEDAETRRDIAEYIKQCAMPSVLFSMLDGRDYSDAIWKSIKPDRAVPFKVDE